MVALNGKAVLVTGASKGIGAAIARSLAAEGAHVLAHYGRDRVGAEEALAAVPVARKTFLSADQNEPGSMDELWREADAIRARDISVKARCDERMYGRHRILRRFVPHG